MNINPYANHVSSSPKDLYPPAPAKGTKAVADSANFDSISVGNRALPDEHTFRELLTAKISMEVRHTAPQEKLDALSAQISQGTYSIDIDAIADAITLRKD